MWLLTISKLSRSQGTAVAKWATETPMSTLATGSDETFYLAAARNAPELSRDSEIELARRWRTSGDRRAADMLARAHQRHVVALAMKYRRYGVPVGDLVAEGNVGVVNALRKFEPERGVRFGTYAAHWVRAQMLAHVVKARSAVGGSDGPLRTQVFFKLRRERARVMNQFGPGEAGERELAKRLGVSPERLRGMLQRLDSRDLSLDADAHASSRQLLDVLAAPDDQEQELLAHQAAGQLHAMVARAMDQLDPRERYILEQHLMAETGKNRSLAAIARSLGVSRERVRQLQERALNKLRRMIAAEANAQ